MADVSARRRVWGWWFFDWASQPYHTLILTFIYGPFFATVAAGFFVSEMLEFFVSAVSQSTRYMSLGEAIWETAKIEELSDARAQSLWSLCLTVTGLIIGFGAPLIGAMADSSGRRRPWILGFSVLYVVGAALLWNTDPAGANMWAMLIAFGIGFIGAEFAAIFVNAQLPGLVDDAEVGKVSGSGFAFGYVGGLISLIFMLVFFAEQPGGKTLVGLDPGLGLLDGAAREGTRFVGPFAALWFIVFMVPYALWVRDNPSGEKRASFRGALAILVKAIRGLAHKKSLTSYLLSSMFYRDALNGLYGFGGVYASLVLNWSIVSIGIFGIVSALSAAVFSWIGGKLDAAFGPKPVIKGAIWVLIGVILVVVFMSRESLFGIALAEGSTLPDTIFFGCGMLIGGMGGMLQSASRTLMVRHADPEAPTESFGLYGLSGRATAFMAPALIGLVTSLTGSARLGVSPLIGLFVLGLVLLVWVKPDGEKV